MAKESEESLELTRQHHKRWRFVQPMAVALVCLVFIVISLTMGMINIKTLHRTLDGFIESKGHSIGEDIQQLAQQYFEQLVRAQEAAYYTDTETYERATLSLQESFLVDLMAAVRKIDAAISSGGQGDEGLVEQSKEENVTAIGILDEQGDIINSNRPISGDIVHLAASVVRGEEEVTIHIFDRLVSGTGWGFIAARRSYDKGVLILALDEKDFQQRCAGFSIQRALRTMKPAENIVYVITADSHGWIIGYAGTPPKFYLESAQNQSIVPDVTTREVESDDQQHLLEIWMTVRVGDSSPYAVGLAFEADILEQILNENRRSLWVSTAFMLGIAFLSIWLLYRNQSRYIDSIRRMERRIQQAQRLSAMGRLAARVAHEIRNPLNAISMAIQRLQRETPHKLTHVIRDEITRLNRIIEEFLSISKSRNLELRPFDIIALLEQIVLLMEEEAQAKGIAIETNWQKASFLVAMDVDRMKQALINILKNGMESISDGGLIHLTVESTGKDEIRLTIRDTGIGLSSEELNRIFDLDYTTKDRGVGLGLPLAHEIIMGHGGQIRVDSRQGSGSTFHIRLPLIGQ